MNKIDEIYTAHPYYGARKIRVILGWDGLWVTRKRIGVLMKIMGLEAIYPKPKTSISNKFHKKYPYLLKNKIITKINEVWGTDITYIRTKYGFVYLVAILDWHSRYIIAWELSITLETEFCLEALERALKINQPEIFNSDQGVQFTSMEFTQKLENKNILISMDGIGRCMDNIFTERLWRTIKYEEVYLKSYETVQEAEENLKGYIDFYNNHRPHQSLDYQTPATVYWNLAKRTNINK